MELELMGPELGLEGWSYYGVMNVTTVIRPYYAYISHPSLIPDRAHCRSIMIWRHRIHASPVHYPDYGIHPKTRHGDLQETDGWLLHMLYLVLSHDKINHGNMIDTEKQDEPEHEIGITLTPVIYMCRPVSLI